MIVGSPHVSISDLNAHHHLMTKCGQRMLARTGHAKVYIAITEKTGHAKVYIAITAGVQIRIEQSLTL